MGSYCSTHWQTSNSSPKTGDCTAYSLKTFPVLSETSSVFKYFQGP